MPMWVSYAYSAVLIVIGIMVNIIAAKRANFYITEEE